MLPRQRKKKDSFEENDEVWAVFDRDEHPNFNSAVNDCEQNGIGVARSNPCFELWLILHYEDYDRPLGRHDVQAHLQSINGSYDPKIGKRLVVEQLSERCEAAEIRAERQIDRREQEGGRSNPPSTTMYLLTRSLRRPGRVSVT